MRQKRQTDNTAWSDGFQILQKGSGMSTVSVWGVDTLCGKVIQLFKVGVPVGKTEKSLVKTTGGGRSKELLFTSQSPSHRYI
jgi:hypothetical protein